DDAHALDLLGQIIGRDRAAAEAEDARALAALCGGLPLALRIAGARLASLLAAPDFPAWAGAALLDTNVAEAEDICERLVDAQLLDAGWRMRSPEIRYHLHDLVRAFARELAIANEPATTRIAALARAFGGWLALAQQAHGTVYGGDFTILHGSAPRWTGSGRVVEQAIQDDPIAWLEGERRAIAAAAQQSAELGLDELSWDLAWTATTLYETRAYFDDWLAVQKSALDATERAGNRRGRAAMLTARSSCMLQLGRFEESRDLAEESLRLFSEAGDPHGSAIAQYRLAVFYVRMGQPEPAVAVCRQAIENTQVAGDFFLGGRRAARARRRAHPAGGSSRRAGVPDPVAAASRPERQPARTVHDPAHARRAPAPPGRLRRGRADIPPDPGRRAGGQRHRRPGPCPARPGGDPGQGGPR
ncbi:MAG TPA: tetratricopeptide repeat protein, partial [Streptosporangiaceae bacterium]